MFCRQTRSLASLSSGAKDILKDDPMFSYFEYGFERLGQKEGHGRGNYGSGPAHEYAHTFVSDLLQYSHGKSVILASLVLHIWMYVVHYLYEFLRSCKKRDRDGMLHALDVAAALWIGTTDSQDGPNSSGYSLYRLAEEVQAYFEHTGNGSTGGTASGANHRFLSMLQSFQTQADISGMCARDEGHTQYRLLIRQTIGYATVPLVQSLVNEVMDTKDGAEAQDVAIFSFAIAPRLAICDPIKFRRFYKKFVRDAFRASDKLDNIAVLQSVYSCLELSCDDIGTYKKATLPACVDENQDTKAPVIAGYQTHSPKVRPVSDPWRKIRHHGMMNCRSVPAWKFLVLTNYPNTNQHLIACPSLLLFHYRPQSLKIDRDILHIRALTFAGNYHSALEIYQEGYNAHDNSNVHVALRDLAVSENRSAAREEFLLFTNYADRDPFAADNIVMGVLDKKMQEDPHFTTGMKTELVVGMIQNLVMYMGILENIGVAFHNCDRGDTQTSLEKLDIAVAYYVGSVEGPNQHGAEDVIGSTTDPYLDHGQLLFTRSKQFCGAFGSCTDDDSDSKANVEIIRMFSALANDLKQQSCKTARGRYKTEVAPLLFVPLLQGLLFCAEESSLVPSKKPDINMVRAYTFAQAVVPYFTVVNKNAHKISALFQFTRDEAPSKNDIKALFAIVADIVKTLQRPPLLSKCDTFGRFDMTGVEDGGDYQQYANVCHTSKSLPLSGRLSPPVPQPIPRNTLRPTPEPAPRSITKPPAPSPTTAEDAQHAAPLPEEGPGSIPETKPIKQQTTDGGITMSQLFLFVAGAASGMALVFIYMSRRTFGRPKQRNFKLRQNRSKKPNRVGYIRVNQNVV